MIIEQNKICKKELTCSAKYGTVLHLSEQSEGDNFSMKNTLMALMDPVLLKQPLKKKKRK